MTMTTAAPDTTDLGTLCADLERGMEDRFATAERRGQSRDLVMDRFTDLIRNPSEADRTRMWWPLHADSSLLDLLDRAIDDVRRGWGPGHGWDWE
jgi:hypothetical protein